MLGPRLLLIVGLLSGYAACDMRAIPVWRSDARLWPHAAVAAPLKPGPLINHAKQLFAAGRDAEAIALVERVERLEQLRGRR